MIPVIVHEQEGAEHAILLRAIVVVDVEGEVVFR